MNENLNLQLHANDTFALKQIKPDDGASYNHSPDISFGSEDASFDPELWSLFKETAEAFLDTWEDAFSLESSWHFRFFRIPIKAVVPDREFLTPSLVSGCSFSDFTSAMESTGIGALASVQMLFCTPTDEDSKHSAGRIFGEAPYWKWFWVFPTISRARCNSFLSRINSRSNISGVLVCVTNFLPSFLRCPRMWLDCPVLLSKESPHNGQE